MVDAPSFAALLAPFDLTTLEADHSVVYLLDAERRIRWANAAWHAHARVNGASWIADDWGIGASVLDATAPVLRGFYTTLFDTVATSGTPATHEYECSSPTEFQLYQMRVLRCASGLLLVVNSKMFAAPHTRVVCEPIEPRYRGPTGLIVSCAHCRRTRLADDTREQWDWVPDFVASVPREVSHGICPVCLEYYFPSDPLRDP